MQRASRISALVVLIASAMGPTGAYATDYSWSNGTFDSQAIPNPLLAGNTLSLLTSSAKGFTTSFENQGTVLWQEGPVNFASVVVTNASGALWEAFSNDAMTWVIGGTPGGFTNNGTFRKSGGSGNTTIANLAFVNNGTLDAQTGEILFTTTGGVFNAGTTFIGAGVNRIANSAGFNGSFTSANLVLSGGTFTGTDAVATGIVVWTGGGLSGGWTNQGTVDARPGAGKGMLGSFVNADTFSWSDDIAFSSSGNITNNDLFDAKGNHALSWTVGATPGSFTNNGTFRKSGGSGSTTITNLSFVNNGILDAQTGEIRFSTPSGVFNAGTQFIGAGTNRIENNAAFNGSFTSANLILAGGTFTGNGAVANGAVLWTGGLLAGNWANQGTFSAEAGSGKGFGGILVNGGTFNWSDDIAFSSSGNITNNGLFDAKGNHALSWTVGATPGSFTNNGTFRKSGGSGSTTITNLSFVNNGILDAQTGEIRFSTPSGVFNAGTQFIGAGTNRIENNAAFNGSFTSANLILAGGTFTGNGAVANGIVTWTGGAFANDWTNQGTINAQPGSGKGIVGPFVNAGTFNWSDDIAFSSSGSVTNNGLFDAKGNHALSWTVGATPPTFTNNGTFRKSGGGANTTISNFAFVNSSTGRIEVQTGTILVGVALDNLGTISTAAGAKFQVNDTFVNDGTIEGAGRVITPMTGLLNSEGTIAPGLGGAPIGELTIQGNLTQSSDGIVVVELGGPSSGDVLDVTGIATLAGTLTVLRLPTYAPAVGDAFQVMTFASRSGQFDQVSFNGFGSGVSFDVLYGATNLTLQVAAVPEPGTWALMLGGLGVVVLLARRRRIV